MEIEALVRHCVERGYRLMELQIGLLMNFGMGTFKVGCTRLANNYRGGE